MDALNRYTGTVLYVSHDRYFINRTATRILDLTQGQLLNYIGNYDYYLEKRDTLETALGLAAPTVPSSSGQDIPSSGAGKLGWQQQKEEQARIRKLQNELKQVEEEITALEVRNEEINQLLTQEDIYTDVARLMELNQEKKELDERLEQLMERWEELSE